MNLRLYPVGGYFSPYFAVTLTLTVDRHLGVGLLSGFALVSMTGIVLLKKHKRYLDEDETN